LPTYANFALAVDAGGGGGDTGGGGGAGEDGGGVEGATALTCVEALEHPKRQLKRHETAAAEKQRCK